MNNKFANITRSSTKASITSLFLQVLDNISTCEKKNLIPIVNFCNKKLLCHDEKYGKNVWEYYFEPVSEFSINDVPKSDIKIRLSKMSKPQQLNYYIGDSGKQKSYLKKFKNNIAPSFNKEHREYFKKIIDKYIKIKPYISDYADDFYEQNMTNKKVLGLFVRGTNKYAISSFKNDSNNNDRFSLERYSEYAKEYMKKTNADKIYVACDSHEGIKFFKKIFEDKMIYQKDYIRYEKNSSKTDPPWDDPTYGPMNNKTKGDLGKENIIETLLLSQCDFLLFPETNMCIAALLYNPNLESKYIL